MSIFDGLRSLWISWAEWIYFNAFNTWYRTNFICGIVSIFYLNNNNKYPTNECRSDYMNSNTRYKSFLFFDFITLWSFIILLCYI